MVNIFKIICSCFFVLFVVLMVLFILRIKRQEEYRQKAVLAQDIHKALEGMMLDLIQARASTVRDVPADGAWHDDRIVFQSRQRGALEYLAQNGHLWRIHGNRAMLVANHIGHLHLRRESSNPGIIEVQIEARSNVSLVSNLRVRMSQ